MSCSDDTARSIRRTDDEYVVTVSFEEFDPHDVTVSWHDGRLHVEAERDDNESDVALETVTFGRKVYPEDINAAREDGSLEVRVPLDYDDEWFGTEIPVDADASSADSNETSGSSEEPDEEEVDAEDVVASDAVSRLNDEGRT